MCCAPGAPESAWRQAEVLLRCLGWRNSISPAVPFRLIGVRKNQFDGGPQSPVRAHVNPATHLKRKCAHESGADAGSAAVRIVTATIVHNCEGQLAVAS